jgi:hypothetical protein
MRSLIEDEPDVDDLDDITALGLLQQVYRCRSVSLHVRLRAAMAALPMETPRLAVTSIVTDNDVATILDRRIAHFERMKLLNDTKLIEATPQEPTNGNNGNADPAQVQRAPLARLYDTRRYSRFPRRA